MAFFLHAQKIPIRTGHPFVALLHQHDARRFGINPGDRVQLQWDTSKVTATANLTTQRVRKGRIGLFRDIWDAHDVDPNDPVQITLLGRPNSVQYIRKKLMGEKLTEPELHDVIADIVSGHLGTIETTYFVAASFAQEYSNQELYALTKAMVETGEQLRFPGRYVVDKHSIGGVAGNRTTLLVVPIIASLGLTIPKTSSRAITSPAGTADTMELLAPVSHSTAAIQRIVRKTKACMVWGGGLDLAPADDKIIQVSRPLSLEPYTKMLVSIMAKKVAMGIRFLVIDLPIGEHTKVPDRKTAQTLSRQFRYLGKRFGITVRVVVTEAHEPVGKGIGPMLEARDALRVLQQKEKRPLDLESKAVLLSGTLLELCGKAKRGQGKSLAQSALTSGKAWKSMRAIIAAQGGDPDVDANTLARRAVKHRVTASRAGRIRAVNNKVIDELARSLGAPDRKLAGIYLHRRLGDRVRRGEKLYTFYSQSKSRMNLALKVHSKLRIYTMRNN